MHGRRVPNERSTHAPYVNNRTARGSELPCPLDLKCVRISSGQQSCVRVDVNDGSLMDCMYARTHARSGPALSGMVEQEICAQADVFIGTRASTMTGIVLEVGT